MICRVAAELRPAAVSLVHDVVDREFRSIHEGQLREALERHPPYLFVRIVAVKAFLSLELDDRAALAERRPQPGEPLDALIGPLGHASDIEKLDSVVMVAGGVGTAAALLDVDLLASTHTCLVHLVPRMRPGGVIFTQDGHIRAIAALLADAHFWRQEVGIAPPAIVGVGERKFLAIRPR